MARSWIAVAAPLASLALLCSGAQAKTTAHKHGRASCASAHSSSSAHHGTRSYKTKRCSKGRAHARGKGAHALFFTAKDGHCPDSGLSPSASDIALVRAATLCLVNRERTARGERPLRWNADLIASAQAHTESMAFGDYFEHIGPNGETPLSRMRKTGYIYSSRLGFEVGENIGWGSLWLGSPKAVVAAWMASPGHRANILDVHFRETGVGVSPHLGTLAHGQSGGIYTQDFGVIVG